MTSQSIIDRIHFLISEEGDHHIHYRASCRMLGTKKSNRRFPYAFYGNKSMVIMTPVLPGSHNGTIYRPIPALQSGARARGIAGSCSGYGQHRGKSFQYHCDQKPIRTDVNNDSGHKAQ
jgi:hypothetical protein